MAKTYYDKKSGYRRFIDSDKFLHRWLGEKKYGKEAIEGKDIHHIDGNKTNNEATNLALIEKKDHFYFTKHEYKKKALAGTIIFFTMMYFISLRLGHIFEARLSVAIIFFIALELATGLISGLTKIHQPDEP